MTDVRPRIGDVPVDEDALDEQGAPLADLAAELDVGVAEEHDAPDDGWRVLDRAEAGYVVIGAPTSDGLWRIGQVRPGDPDARIEVHPEPMRRRPSIASRRRGLELQWPTSEVDLDAPAIDVVNVGAERWVPDGESFHAVGVLTAPGETTFSFGWVASAQASAVVLDPGERTRVAVTVGASGWQHLSPGAHDLHVVIPSLNLHAEPRRVEVTSEQIARRKPPRDRADPARRRRMLQDEADRLRLSLHAGRSLVMIAEAAASAASDDEAVERIATVLGCDAEAARSLLHSPLSDLLPANAAWLQERLDQVTGRIDTL